MAEAEPIPADRLPTEGTARWVNMIVDDVLEFEFGPKTRSEMREYARKQLLIRETSVLDSVSKSGEYDRHELMAVTTMFALSRVEARYWTAIWFSGELQNMMLDVKIRLGIEIVETLTERAAGSLRSRAMVRVVCDVARACEKEVRRVNQRPWWQWWS